MWWSRGKVWGVYVLLEPQAGPAWLHPTAHQAPASALGGVWRLRYKSVPWELLDTNFSSERGCHEFPFRAVNLPFPVVAGLTLAGFACCDTFGGTGHMDGCEDKPQLWALQADPQGLGEPAQFQEPTGVCPQPCPVQGGPEPTLC